MFNGLTHKKSLLFHTRFRGLVRIYFASGKNLNKIPRTRTDIDNMVRGNKTGRGGLGKQAPYRTGGRVLSSIHCRFTWANLEVPSRVLRHFARTQVQSAVLEVHRPTTDGERKPTRTITGCLPAGSRLRHPSPTRPAAPQQISYV